MPVATIIQLLPYLLSALSPLFQRLAGAHASGDLAVAQAVAGELQSAVSLAQQAGTLVAKCQAESRDPTADEWAPFDAAWQAAQDQLEADLNGTGIHPNDGGGSGPGSGGGPH